MTTKLTLKQISELLCIISNELKVFIPFSTRMKIYDLYKETYSEDSTAHILFPKGMLDNAKKCDINNFESKYCAIVMKNNTNYDVVAFLNIDDVITVLNMKR